MLLHGFPYDPHAFDEIVPALTSRRCRSLVPYLRGYGPTRFLSTDTPRAGQQAALAQDLLDFLDGLAIQRPILVGYDWGGRAACIAAALWPGRVAGLVTCGGYNIQDIARSARPAAPEQEHRLWYQYYFHTERGRAGLAANRYELCKLLWRLWSPTWQFSDETYAETAKAFENPDFVEVVLHSYRHRYGYVAGDPTYEAIEADLAEQPSIRVPTVALFGMDDGVTPLPPPAAGIEKFAGRFERRDIPGAGHNLPQEKPDAVVDAVLQLLQSV